MSALRGNRGKLTVGANADVAQVTQWSVQETGDTIEDTSMDPTAADGPIPKTFIAGNTSWTMSVTCNVDRSDIDGQAALRAGAVVEAKLYPEGDTTGKKYWSGNAIVTSLQEQGEVNGKIVFTGALNGTGALTLATA